MNRYRYVVLALIIIMSMSILPVASAQSECSQGSGEQFETSFINDTETPLTIHWINFECEEQDGIEIEPDGGVYSMITYDGHTFVFRDDEGDNVLTVGVNNLIADETSSIKQWISEGAAASVMWETFNPMREEIGLEPIYFSDALYDIAEEAAILFEEMAEEEGLNMDDIMDGSELSPMGDIIFDLANDVDAGWAGHSIGVRFGELATTDELTDIMTMSFEEIMMDFEDTGEPRAWLGEDVQSFAVYADEHVFVYLFSSRSQPELDTELAEREAEEEMMEEEMAEEEDE